MMRYITVIEQEMILVLLMIIMFGGRDFLPLIAINIIAITLAILLIIFIAYFFFLSRRLPGRSKYSPFGFIEAHIDNKNKGNMREFYRIFARIIKVGIKKKKNIVFTGWQITECELKKRFGTSLITTKPSIIEKLLLGKIVRPYYESMGSKTHINNPLIKVIIKYELLTSPQIQYIDRMAK